MDTFAPSIKYLHHTKKKNIISLTIAFAFLSIAITGLLLYFAIKSGPVTAIHVAFGLLFIGFAIFHIKNNRASKKAYSTEQKGGSGIKKNY
jgi:undecaprenyl pyrophosphate phosphatase UppP